MKERESTTVHWWLMNDKPWQMIKKFHLCFLFFLVKGALHIIIIIKYQIKWKQQQSKNQLWLAATNVWESRFGWTNSFAAIKCKNNNNYFKQCCIKSLERGIFSERGWHNWRLAIDHHHWWEIICGKSHSTFESDAQVWI